MISCKNIRTFLIINSCFLLGCGPSKFDCEQWTNDFKNEYAFDIAVNKIEKHGVAIYFYGKDRNNQDTYIQESTGWTSAILDTFKVGDTIRKNYGEYSITIKRKSGTIIIPMKCEGHIYRDSVSK